MACSVLGAVCFVQACVLIVWAEKLYGAVTVVRAFLARHCSPKEPEPPLPVLPLAELRSTAPLLTPMSALPIPGPALTSETFVSVVPEPEPVLPPRPSVPAPPSLPPRYRSQEASASSGSFVSAEDHLYEPIRHPPNAIRQTGIKYYKTFLLLKLVVVNLRILII